MQRTILRLFHLTNYVWLGLSMLLLFTRVFTITGIDLGVTKNILIEATYKSKREKRKKIFCNCWPFLPT